MSGVKHVATPSCIWVGTEVLVTMLPLDFRNTSYLPECTHTDFMPAQAGTYTSDHCTHMYHVTTKADSPRRWVYMPEIYTQLHCLLEIHRADLFAVTTVMKVAAVLADEGAIYRVFFHSVFPQEGKNKLYARLCLWLQRVYLKFDRLRERYFNKNDKKNCI